jgi:hypothetical protein
LGQESLETKELKRGPAYVGLNNSVKKLWELVLKREKGREGGREIERERETWVRSRLKLKSCSLT